MQSGNYEDNFNGWNIMKINIFKTPLIFFLFEQVNE